MEIKERSTPEQNATDPLKLLLIYALRFGIVNSKSVQECYSEAGSRQDKAVVWEHPDWPVVSAWGRSHRLVLADKGLKRSNKLGTSFALAMRSAGLMNLWPDTYVNRHRLARTRGLVQDLGVGSVQSTSPELNIEGDEFMQTFASINVVRAPNDTHMMVHGGSRDTPTPFMFHCENTQFGCEYTSRNPYSMVEHRRICRITSREAEQQLPRYHAARPYCCSVCNTRYRYKKSLYSHWWRNHQEWTPRKCGICDCSRIFATYGQYHVHVAYHHGSWKPTQCPVNNCDKSTYYQNQKVLSLHLRRRHWKLPIGEQVGIIRRLRAKHGTIPEDGWLSREESGLDIDTYTQPLYGSGKVKKAASKAAKSS